MATKVLVLFLAVVVCAVTAQHRGRTGTLRQGPAQTAAQRQFQQLQIALQLPPGTQIHQGSNPPPAQPGMVWIQVPTQGSYPQQPQQPGNYPGGYPQKPGTYPQQPQQPGNYPQQPQQPGNYPAGYPQQPQQPGTYPQQPQQPQQPQNPPVQVGGDILQPPASAYPPPSYPAPIPPYPGNQPIRPDSDPEANPEPVDGITEETGQQGLSPGQETGVGGGGTEGGGSWEVPEGQGPGTGEVQSPPSPLLVYCRAPRGQYPSPTSCNTFINCWDDNVVEQQCPGGTVFNELGFCDYPENVDCSNRGGAGGPPPPAEGMGENAACPTPYGAYRSTTSCGIFYVCNAGTPNRFECPEGLNYNTDLGVCDYPYRVDCGGTPSERPAPEIPSPEIPTPDENENGGGEYYPDPSEAHKYYGGLKKIPANMLDSRVPCRSNAVFKMNPSCSSVSLCRNGYSTVINCSTGTAWDSRAQKCINVYQARC